MERCYGLRQWREDVFRDVSVTRPANAKEAVRISVQPLEKKWDSGNQARLRRSIRAASPSRLRVAVAGSGTAPATTYCTLTSPFSV